MIYFDLKNLEMIFPNGKGMDISTKKGSNLFLQGESSFDFFTTKVMELEHIRLKDRDRSIEVVAQLLAKNANKKLFREKIPVLEIECWLQHSVAEIQKLVTKPNWTPEEKLQEHEILVLNQCSAMFLHAVPVALAFESNFFQVLTKYTTARNGNSGDFSSEHICEHVLSIVWNAFITSTSRSNGWSAKTAFKQLAASGILEEFIRCLVSPKLEPHLSEGIDTMLQQLQLCSNFLKNKFQIGDSCGDALRAVLEDKAGIRKTRDHIFQRLENIVLSVDSMCPTVKPKQWCSHCRKFENSKDFQESLMICSRCRNASYCSRECQVADWNRHSRCCSSAVRSMRISLNILSVRVGNFMKSHYATMMIKMVEQCDKTSLKMQDMIIQLDYMPNEIGVIPALQDPPIFKVAPIRDHIEGAPPPEPNWYDSRSGKYTYLCIDPIKNLKSKQRPDHVTFLVRSEEGIQCFNIEMDKRGTDETVSAFRSALQDSDFEPLTRIFDNEEATQLSSQIQNMHLHQDSEDSSSSFR